MIVRTLAGLCAVLLLIACGGRQTAEGQAIFESRELAMSTLLGAVEADDTEAVVRILGPQYAESVVTPDWGASRESNLRIVAAAREQLRFEPAAEGRSDAIIGTEEWPFPFPLVEEEGGWRFDTAAGLEEVVDRRVGRNELAAIKIADAYVDAQIEYALVDRDGDGRLEYAQRLSSSPGERDGLYWETQEGEPESPLGPLVRGAERYLDTLDPGDPLRGYYFTILKKQGPNAPGGAYDYLVGDRMVRGFALVAHPADYGNTGVMTFVVDHRGVVRQKDIGPFAGMDAYDPDESWEVVADAS